MELKPCPLCGGKAECYLQEHHIDNFWNKNTVICPACGIRMEDASKTILFKKWNRRAEDGKRKT